MSLVLRYFFVRQKTAYELLISVWSSDVCSSDLCQYAVFHCMFILSVAHGKRLGRIAEKLAPMIAQGEKSLRGLRVFLVEDEALVAMLLEHMLSDMGGVIVGQAQNVVGARTQMEQMAWSADVALLDIHPAGERSEEDTCDIK